MSKLSFEGKFTGIEHMKEVIVATFPNDFVSSTCQMGYIQPGHGAKGRQLWLSTDADVLEMYSACEGKKEILLWFFKNEPIQGLAPPSKRPCHGRGQDDVTSSKGELLAKRMTEVDEIVASLTEKHSQHYTLEQIRAWAHMIYMDKAGYENPPDKPFFKNRNRKSVPLSSSSTASPKKRIELRSECMDQLQKWHNLLDKDVISKEQYDELREKILKDITDL